MLEAVKVLRTEGVTLEIKGYIPDDLLKFLHNHYGDALQIEDDDDELLNVTDTQWYKDIKASITPADALSIYRENYGMTQEQVAKKVGTSRHRISEFERNVRGISKDMAKKFAKVFDVQVGRFI